MPGFHFVHSSPGGFSDEHIDAALKELLHDSRYTSEIVHRNGRSQLGLTRYQDYPVEIHNDDDYLIVIEGRLHPPDGQTVSESVRSLTNDIFAANGPETERLRKWLLQQDGDFNILLWQKNRGQWAFINDALGRLPTYLYCKGRRFALTRELRFVARLFGSPPLDRMAIAQYLLFGYPLGRRTLIDGLDRLPPATLLQWSDADPHPKMTVLRRLSFDGKKTNVTIESAVEELTSLFIDACRRQHDPRRTSVLSLSGGLDSRAVAAGLQKAGVSFKAFTFEDRSGGFAADARFAGELAERLHLEWELYPLPAATGKNLLRIMRMKGGMNYVASAFALPFMDYIEHRCGGNVAYFSGDGGDKLLPNLRPPRRLPSLRRLVDFIIERHSLLPIELVARLTNLDVETIRASIVSVIESYAEESCEQKYVHFMICERAMKWLFEGEDCNRCHFWTSTPFYSLPFFEAAMRIPDEVKQNHALYREFLMRLSPEAADIADASCGKAITANSYQRRKQITSWLARYPKLLRSVKSLVTPATTYSYMSPTIQALVSNAMKVSALSEYIDDATLRWAIGNCAEYNREAYDNLLTISLLAEDMYGDICSFAPFEETVFT